MSWRPVGFWHLRDEADAAQEEARRAREIRALDPLEEVFRKLEAEVAEREAASRLTLPPLD